MVESENGIAPKLLADPFFGRRLEMLFHVTNQPINQLTN